MMLAEKQTELGMIIGEGGLRQTSATCFPSDAEPRSAFLYTRVCVRKNVCAYKPHTHTGHVSRREMIVREEVYKQDGPNESNRISVSWKPKRGLLGREGDQQGRGMAS